MDIPSVLLRLVGAALFTGALIAFGISERSSPVASAFALAPRSQSSLEVTADGDWKFGAKGHIPMPQGAMAAHASALVAMPDNHPDALMAFWFAGDRESAPNVQIASASFNRASQSWGEARFVVNRHDVGAQLGFGVRRLGNPVAWLDASGRMHLFVVATGWGGWAAGRILHLQQRQGSLAQDVEFDPVGLLPLSWLWNTSFLVRTAPLALADGGMVLPAYFELGFKYPVALRFDGNGNFLGMVRISNKRFALQPALLAQSATQWLALMRDNRDVGKIIAAQTVDAGQSWTDLPDLALDNPDSAIATLVSQGQHWLVHNDSLHSRERLTLSRSPQGREWSTLLRLEDGAPGQEFSYPAIVQTNNSLWISYTDQRRRIAWQRLDLKASVSNANPSAANAKDKP
jgi:predicted neuraminidase